MVTKAAKPEQLTQHDAVHQLLGRAFLRIEQEVIKTQSLDAAPGSMGDPYGRLADSALAEARCARVLDGPARDVVTAYWTARGLVRELQSMMADQGERARDDRKVRDLSPREQDMMRAKDNACLRLVRPVRDALNYRPQKHSHINVNDLLLDLIREWAGVHKEGQSRRLAETYDMDPSTYRKLRAGWTGRRGRPGNPGVHGILNDHYRKALDQLAHAMTAEDLRNI